MAQALEESAVELLRWLIREDTVNPPGNERELQERLAAMLTEAGFECELLAAEPERPNLVARLRGDGDGPGQGGPTLAYLGHVDTVRADPEEWTRDPWSGDLEDGWVWGRGALDMKGQVASELAAGMELASSGWRPKGELLLVITSDEEAGGDLGARWLCEQHPDKVRCDFVVNEGGGATIAVEGRRLYTLSVGEKGIFRIQLRVTGQAGHASLPQGRRQRAAQAGAADREALEAAAARAERRGARVHVRLPGRAAGGGRRAAIGPRADAGASSRCSPTCWSSRCWESR